MKSNRASRRAQCDQCDEKAEGVDQAISSRRHFRLADPGLQAPPPAGKIVECPFHFAASSFALLDLQKTSGVFVDELVDHLWREGIFEKAVQIVEGTKRESACVDDSVLQDRIGGLENRLGARKELADRSFRIDVVPAVGECNDLGFMTASSLRAIV